MSAKGRKHWKWKDGYFSGYSEWRYGKARKARQRHRAAILRGQRREHVINRVMEILRDWRQSPFEHEGSVLAGLRSGLCLEGYNWSRADEAAAEVVATALRRIGAVRPTWEQGQREYVEPRENCVRCGAGLAAEQIVRREGFCSDWCAASTKAHNGRMHRIIAKRVESAGRHITAKEAAKPRPCHYCGSLFKAANPLTTHCSLKCAGLDKRTIPERACDQCGKLFRPSSGDKTGRFCSLPCYHAFGRTGRHVRICVWCGTGFVGKMRRSESCSVECRQKINGLSRSTVRLRPISPSVIDFIFRRQGLRITDDRLAA